MGTGRPVEIDAKDNRPTAFSGRHPRLFSRCKQTLQVHFIRKGGNVLDRLHPHECLLQEMNKYICQGKSYCSFWRKIDLILTYCYLSFNVYPWSTTDFDGTHVITANATGLVPSGLRNEYLVQL